MNKTNFKIVFRNLVRNKTLSFINIMGLAIALAAVIIILIYVEFELSYENFHQNRDNIYRIYHERLLDGEIEKWAKTAGPFAKYLKDNFPEIEETVRIVPIENPLIISDNKRYYEDHFFFADPQVLDVFTIPLITGDKHTALLRPNTVIISDAIVSKYFGDDEPIGKELRIKDSIYLEVIGVFESLPLNTHLKMDFIASIQSVNSVFKPGFLDDLWNNFSYTYILVNPATDIKQFSKKIKYLEMQDDEKYILQPIESIHLHSKLGGEIEPNNDIRYVIILLLIVVFILLLAIINYFNLFTGSYKFRYKEIGIKKLSGSSKSKLFYQIIVESLVYIFLSLFIAYIIVESCLPCFSKFTGRPLDLNNSHFQFIVTIFMVFIIVGILSGVFPGMQFSRLTIIRALGLAKAQDREKLSLKLILFCIQFVITIVLIISSLIIYKQINYIRNKNLGIDKESIIYIPLRDPFIKHNPNVLKQKLLQNPQIVNISATSYIPGGMFWVTSVDWEGYPEDTQTPTMPFLKADKDFLKLFNIKVIKGNGFENAYINQNEHCYLINESAVRRIGWEYPIGKDFYSYHGKEGKIIGVINDFHFKSLHEEVEPLFISLFEDNLDYLFVKMRTEETLKTIDFMRREWESLSKDYPFELHFYDKYLDDLYSKEKQMSTLILIFTLISIVISCLGMVGLSLLNTQQRTKEIGIRKINGSKTLEIILMLSKDFSKWVAIAFVIACPIAYYFMNKWLQNFAYRTDLSWWIFAAAGVIALLVAILTVSWQSWREASRNPVESLRYE